MLKAFRQYKAAREEEEESLWLSGFATPRSNDPGMDTSGEYVKWSEVESFLQMAEQALRVRMAANENLHKELESMQQEQRKVEKTSSAAQEESSFLTEHMQSLLDERTALKEALEKAQREKAHLARENDLLRQELLEGAALGEESSAALQLLARQQEELRAAQQLAVQLENDNVQLQARVSALERANTAQATAMLSCLEESERVRLQQLSISTCDSPLGPLAAHAQRSEYTDDSSAAGGGLGGGSSYVDAESSVDLRSEASGSFVSCTTPLASATSSGAATGSIFRSTSSSPPEHQQHGAEQRQQRQAPAPAGQPAASKRL